MECLFPYQVKNASFYGGVSRNGETSHIPVPCGKCYNCKMTLVSQWSFRIEQEEKKSYSSIFLTLTYDPQFVPISKNGFMTLDKRDLQLFFKRLRKNIYGNNHSDIKYFAVGEYGGLRHRPHYHIVLLNCTIEECQKAWIKPGVFDIQTRLPSPLGICHAGSVTGNSIAYTLKYMMKESKIPMHKNDDRLKEFRLMSKNLGKSYLSPEIIKYHRESIENFYLRRGEYKISIPRYYKQKIWKPEELEQVHAKIAIRSQKNQQKKEEDYENSKSGYYIQDAISGEVLRGDYTHYKRSNNDYKRTTSEQRNGNRNID